MVVNAPTGWGVITFVDDYLKGKTPAQLAALARVQGDLNIVRRLATFFRQAEDALR
jgi:hypothetical protein